jgi:uncharacterized protein
MDSSALVKLYLPEPGADALNEALNDRGDVAVSDLVITEICSALARKLREGSMELRFVKRAYRELLDHLEAENYQRLDLLPASHREAERLLFAAKSGLRAADALHLAMALQFGMATLVTYDRRLSEAARDVGLHVFP